MSLAVVVGCGGSLGVTGVGASAGGLIDMVITPLRCFLFVMGRCAVHIWSEILVGWSL